MPSPTPPGGTPEFDVQWQTWADPEDCTSCRQELQPGYMVCPSCGAYVLRSRYPMHGDWNRRIDGVAVSGWGYPFDTGARISVTFSPNGVTVSKGARHVAQWDWADVVDLAVAGPDEVRQQGFNLIPMINFADPSSAAVNVGLPYLINNTTSKTSLETLVTLMTTESTLVVRNTAIDRQALRWLLQPAFTAQRLEQLRQGRLVAQRKFDELGWTVPHPEESPDFEGEDQ